MTCPRASWHRTYAVNLARAASTLPELELTLLVQNPKQARGMQGRVVTAGTWADDVAVIHKPAQVMDPADLRLLFESKARLVITYQDLIAFRIPLVFASERRFESYRATSRLMLPAVQGVIAISDSVRCEIAGEFGIPPDEIPVVMHAADDSCGRRIAQAGRPFGCPSNISSAWPAIIRTRISATCSMRTLGSGCAGRTVSPHNSFSPAMPLGPGPACILILSRALRLRAWFCSALSRSASLQRFTNARSRSFSRRCTRDSGCLRSKRWRWAHP